MYVTRRVIGLLRDIDTALLINGSNEGNLKMVIKTLATMAACEGLLPCADE